MESKIPIRNRGIATTIAVFAVMTVVCLSFSVMDSEGDSIYQDGLSYYIEDDGTATLIGFDTDIKELIIPETIVVDGVVHPVTSIRNYVDGALVEKIVIPDSVEFIYHSSFYYCYNLESLDLGEGVKEIQDYAFAGCVSLESVTIPASVTTLGYAAFSYCTSLESFTVDPDNPNYVSVDGAIYTKDMSVLMFSPMKNTGEFTVLDGVREIANHAFYGSSFTSVSLPDSVEVIGYYAFEGCRSLTSIDIGEGVVSIHSYAFEGCSSLKTIHIPASVTEIGENFYGCESLVGIEVDPDNPVYASVDGVLFSKDMSTLIHFPAAYDSTSYTIPSGVETIGDYAFYATPIQHITMPEGVVDIGVCAFEDCVYLKEMVLPSTIVTIGSYAFYHCDAMESLIINEGVENIGFAAFEDCGMLTSVIIPDSVTYLGMYAFEDCVSLESVIIGDGITDLQYSVFDHCESLREITIPSSVESIDSKAFSSCFSLSTISLDEGNTSFVLVDGVLYNADMTKMAIYPQGSDRTEFEIPSTITSINNGDFVGAVNLQKVIIHAAVDYIDDGAFRYCSSLKEVVVDPNNKNYTTVDGVLFSKDMEYLLLYLPTEGRTSYDVPDGVKYIDSYAFSDDTLVSVTMSDSVVRIRDYAFYRCDSLESVDISMVERVDGDSIYYCPSVKQYAVDPENPKYEVVDGVLFDEEMITLVLYPAGSDSTSYVIPDGVLHIESYSFLNAVSLKNVVIPESVMEIHSYAFASCDSLENITIPLSVKRVSSSAFYGVCGWNGHLMPGDTVGHVYEGGVCKVCGISDGSSGDDNTTYYIIAVVLAILIVGVVVYLKFKR